MLESPCMAGRKGREGLFPATACIKLAGYYDDVGDHMIIRDCTVDSGSLTVDTELGRMSHCGAFVFADSGTLTTDTEIIRMSHCGGIVFNDKYVKGCLQSCDDYEGCNSAPSSTSITSSFTLAAALLSLLLLQRGS
ncbi:hypothetical protein GWK47_028908 [Chionoecetes opilio]|uniref:Uncharacterized protein n=1 Tax=Chionoecetes opilio TaxID=41210 RepID=A0A8J4YSX0_CHIOP|nr:hypothetical protein GWK47_028908 [Chionoecetes opilio]